MALLCKHFRASALILLVLVVLSLIPTDAQNIGVCYGRFGNNLPSAQDTVNLYNSNGISKMRIYSPAQEILRAVQGSSIGLIVDIPNGNDLQSLGSDPSTASQWVQNNVVPYASNIRYIAVGNEVMPDHSDAQFVLPAMQNVQNALGDAGLTGQIKVSTAVRGDLVSNTYPPSNGVFSGAASDYFSPIVNFLKSNGSPLLANVYPYFSLVGNPQNISPEYALFTSSGTVVTDPNNGLQYQNLFDAQVDAFYAALEKAGGDGVGIVVSESGWPSQGTDVANADNAGIYYRNLIGHVASGTPKKPGQGLETYLFAMYDENTKGGDEVERHFGLFTPDQQSKYGISSFNG